MVDGSKMEDRFGYYSIRWSTSAPPVERHEVIMTENFPNAVYKLFVQSEAELRNFRGV